MEREGAAVPPLSRFCMRMLLRRYDGEGAIDFAREHAGCLTFTPSAPEFDRQCASLFDPAKARGRSQTSSRSGAWP
jgi:hypothetical protein